jgi:hypothetical protein
LVRRAGRRDRSATTLVVEVVERRDAGKAEVVVSGWESMSELDIVAFSTGMATILEFSGRSEVSVVG